VSRSSKSFTKVIFDGFTLVQPGLDCLSKPSTVPDSTCTLVVDAESAQSLIFELTAAAVADGEGGGTYHIQSSLNVAMINFTTHCPTLLPCQNGAYYAQVSVRFPQASSSSGDLFHFTAQNKFVTKEYSVNVLAKVANVELFLKNIKLKNIGVDQEQERRTPWPLYINNQTLQVK